MKKNRKTLKPVVKYSLAGIGVTAALLLTFVVPQRVMAYATASYADINRFSVGETKSRVEEKFVSPTVKTGTTEFDKNVTVRNTSGNQQYVRVFMEISDPDAAKATQFSGDNGATWYSAADYKNHLPSGWTYKDGFYYYTSLVNGGQTPATPLLTKVKTTYAANQDVYAYDIIVKEESIDKLDNHGKVASNWEEAWNSHHLPLAG